MLWILMALLFLLTTASGLRWMRVAQQGGYAPGSVLTLKRRLVEPGSADRVLFIAVIVLSTLALVMPILALPAAVLWLRWPRSLPLRDSAAPLAWDRQGVRFFSTFVAVMFLMLTATFVGLIYLRLFLVGLLPLLVITASEWTLRMGSPKAATA